MTRIACLSIVAISTYVYNIQVGSIIRCIVCRFSVRVDVPIAAIVYQTSVTLAVALQCSSVEQLQLKVHYKL